MRQHFYLSPIAVCLALAISPVHAAEPLLLDKTSFNDLQKMFQLAPSLARRSVSVSTDSLQFVKQHIDENKITHVRMQQQYEGFPVFGGYAILHSKHSGTGLLHAKNAVKMNGVVYRDLKTELGQPSASFVEGEKIALQKFKEQYKRYSVSEEKVTSIVYIDHNHQAFWAYKVSVLLSHDDDIPERPTAIVDAQTLKPFLQWNEVKTFRSDIRGMGFGGNSVTGKYTFGEKFPFLQLTRNDSSAMCYMENKAVKIVDMGHRYSGPNLAMRFDCNQGEDQSLNIYWTGYQGDGLDQENGAYSPTNDALYAGQVIHNMYKDWYGINVLANQEGEPMKLVLRVHFGEGFENAFWDGRQMTFGDGDSMMHPLVSLGIGAHEISHGFTEQHADLEYFEQSGGMNEAFSDMASQAAEYYSQGKNSWAIGAEVMKAESGHKALRYMDEPSRDGRSIDRADQYREGLNVHHSSGVYNRLFYLLANQPQWNVRQAFHVMIKANMDYWTPYSTFEEGGCGLINAAHDLGFSVADVKQSLEQVSINYQNCNES